MKKNIKQVNMKLYKTLLFFIAAVISPAILFAQQEITVNDVVIGNAEISASNRITLSDGFHAKEGCTFRAYISPEANGGLTNPVIVSAPNVNVSGIPTSTENYIRTTTFPTTGIRSEQVEYFDGLGRPGQIINVEASPEGDDMIKLVYYDNFGRKSREYLPYVDNGNGKYQTNATNKALNFYGSLVYGKDAIDSKPYSVTDYEESPLNRVLSITGVGQDWHTNNKPVAFNYRSNSSITSWNELGDTRNYPANSLYVYETTDENGNVTREYKDKLERIVLKESVVNGENLRTHYIYDNYGLLRTVVPPLASSPADGELCYFYEYDEQKRMISKKLPGAEPVYMVYDKRDRLVLTQDGNLRDDSDAGNETYHFIKYDELNRPILEGKIKFSAALDAQTLLDSHTVHYETYNGSNSSYGYSLNSSFPAGLSISASDVETVTWYDTYNFVNDLSKQSELAYYTTNLPPGFEPGHSDKTTGLVTGTMVKAYEPEGSGYSIARSEMYSANYYDDYGNNIQTISQHHLGGRDVFSSRHQNVTQLLMQTQQQHIQAGKTLRILEAFDYDHAGRLLETLHQVNDQQPVVLTAMRYNELGELVEKYMHSKDGNNFVQKVDYTYNIRGWLTKINDPVLADNDIFGMQLYYNDRGSLEASTVSREQFNGNIAAMRWATIEDEDKIRGYGFEYDALNRLTTANYAEGNTLASNKNLYSMSASYDKNGNFETLNRRFNSASTYADELTYSYIAGTNKLKKVTDPRGDIAGVEDYVALSAADYDYDDNGNMVFDAGKDLEVKYNSLNLPEKISEFGGASPAKIFYHYNAAGVKLAKTNETSTSSVEQTTEYVGNVIYMDGEIAYVATAEGRMVPVQTDTETNWHYEYNIKDHLGNTRVTFGGSLLSGKVDLIQQSHYYPFGLVFKQENYQNALADYNKNKYLYNGKELQDDQLAGRSLNWYDYGARMYDAALGRWHSVDPLSEMYLALSPYHYAGNNPVNNIDIDGRSFWKSQWMNQNVGHWNDANMNYVLPNKAEENKNEEDNNEENSDGESNNGENNDGENKEDKDDAQADGRAAWLDDPDSFHNSTFARILYPDAWVITGVGTIAWKGGVSVEIGTVIMQRGPKAGKRRDFIMPAGETGYAFNGGIKIMGINFAGPVSEIDFSRFQSLAINADLSIIQAPKIGFSATWSPDPTMESFGVLGRGGSFGGGFLPASATVGVGYPFWISDEY